MVLPAFLTFSALLEINKERCKFVIVELGAIHRIGVISRFTSNGPITLHVMVQTLVEDQMDTLDENAAVISASKVTGTNVYNTQGDQLGEIYDVMVDKRSGRIAYAIMSFGGFLGIGERYHPLPWATLKYDTRQGGYVVGLTKEQLEAAPTFGGPDVPAWGDRGYETRIHDYYKTSPYWAI